MTFPDLALEQKRVLAATSMDIGLDPRNTADLVVVVLLSCIFAINLVAVVFLIFNRKYPPLRSKSPVLMVIMFVASVFWFVGDLQVNGHVTLAGSVFTNCRGFGFWVRVLLGICTVTAVVAIRTHAFYHVFTLTLPLRSWRFVLPIIVYFTCILVFGIVAMALSPSKSAEYVPQLDVCNLDEPFKITIFVFIWVSLAFVAFLTWMIRNIKSSFRETWEMVFACVIVLGAMTFNSAVQFSHPRYPLERKYRVVSTLFDMACVNALWWGVLAKPLFNCLFRREAYLKAWISKLRRDGLQREYEVESEHDEYRKQNATSDATFVKGSSSAGLNGFFYQSSLDENMWKDEDGIAEAYKRVTGSSSWFGEQNNRRGAQNAGADRELAMIHQSNDTYSTIWLPSADGSHGNNVYMLDDFGGRRIL